MGPTERLILFARRPRLGCVKTRLVPPLREAQALALYTAFLRDQARFLASFANAERAVEIGLDGPPDPALDTFWLPPEVDWTVQGDGDLGARMLRAFRRSRGVGAERTVIFGADAPALPAAHVAGAFEALATGADVVVDPAPDGGYVLIGMREPRAALFDGIAWGGPDVAEQTLARAGTAGLKVAALPGCADVDRPDDLERLARDLALDPGRAPATAATLRALVR